MTLIHKKNLVFWKNLQLFVIVQNSIKKYDDKKYTKCKKLKKKEKKEEKKSNYLILIIKIQWTSYHNL